MNGSRADKRKQKFALMVYDELTPLDYTGNTMITVREVAGGYFQVFNHKEYYEHVASKEFLDKWVGFTPVSEEQKVKSIPTAEAKELLRKIPLTELFDIMKKKPIETQSKICSKFPNNHYDITTEEDFGNLVDLCELTEEENSRLKVM